MTEERFEIFPERSLAGKRWDLLCAAILFVPLVVMAYQGDILFDLFERVNFRGWFTTVQQKETELAEVGRQIKQLEAEAQGLDTSSLVHRNRLRELRSEQAGLRLREEDLNREIDSRRDRLDEAAARWNFSFVRSWPQSLLLSPLFLALLWFGIAPQERRRLWQEALDGGARTRGLLFGLAAIAVFWIGAWQQNALHRNLILNQGTPNYVAPLAQRCAFVLVYLSMGAWFLAAVYAFTGRRGVKRIWAPLAVFLALMVLQFTRESSLWTAQWDKDERWGYGYFVGPIAAMLLYFKLTEQWQVFTRERQLYIGQPPWVRWARRSALASPGGETEAEAGDSRAAWVLLAGGLALIVPTAAAWAVTQWFGRGPVLMVRHFAPVPMLTGVLVAGLAAWKFAHRTVSGDLAVRLAGVVVLIMSVAFRWQALAVPVHYFAHVSMVGVLLGGVAAVFGFRVFRVAWVATAFLVLAIPWPERTYVNLANPAMLFAAKMAARLMGLVGYTINRDGTSLQILPGGDAGRLHVAEECSGLKMLLAFVALSVVYAYISKRPVWRRVVILLSAFPIAVAANVARVFAMALFFRWGYKGITEGLQHMLAGFLIMLPMAFGLLWLEMRVLDLIEKLADYLAGEQDTSGGEPESGAAKP